MKKLMSLFLVIVLAVFLSSCAAPQQAAVVEETEKEMAVEQEQEPVATQAPEVVESEQPNESGEKMAEYSKIKQSEAKRLMDEENPLVIDVREDYEYDEKHITGAILSPLGNIHNDIANLTDDKDALILIYCRSGNRSRTATEILLDLGYTNVHDFGGIIDWAYEVDR